MQPPDTAIIMLIMIIILIIIKTITIIIIIVSITKFSIVIGSPRAYLSRKSARDHVGVQLQVSDLNFL